MCFLVFSQQEGFEVFFFFQAEDGIRDIGVTGVQTCALPILMCFGCSAINTDGVTLEIQILKIRNNWLGLVKCKERSNVSI